MPSEIQIQHTKYKKDYADYLEIIKPYVEAKTKIYATAVPVTVVLSNGEVKTEYHFNKETKAILHNLDVCIFRELEIFRKSI